MDVALLLAVGMAASDAWAQPPFGGPPPMPGPPMVVPPPIMGGLPMGRPPIGGMMGPPGMGMGIGGRPGPIPKGAGGAPGVPGNRPPLGSSPAGVASGRPIPGRQVLGGAGGGPADLGRVGIGGRPEPGRAINSRHASWYHGGWANSRGATWDKGRDSAGWDKVRDDVREQRAWDYAAGLAGGLGGWASSGYGSSSGLGTNYSSGSGYGTSSGSGDASANPSSDAPSTDGGSSRTGAAGETEPDRQQDAAADRGYQAFYRARDAFKAGDYVAVLDLTDAALKDVPGDPSSASSRRWSCSPAARTRGPPPSSTMCWPTGRGWTGRR
jgi:hypothetical protein